MEKDDFLDCFFYQQQASIEYLIDTAKHTITLNKKLREKFSDNLAIRLFVNLYNLGEGLIRHGIYGEGIKCFEEALEMTRRNPEPFLSKMMVFDALNFPNKFMTTLHTLFSFYFSTNHKKKLKEVITESMFLKNNGDAIFAPEWFAIINKDKARKACIEIRKIKGLENLIGVSEYWLYVLQRLDNIATSPENVLISGPSGVGKELVAKAIHKLRGKGEFYPINCATISDDLAVSELFGAEKGAYTGALTTQVGLCESVGEGTLFLDEIHTASLRLQQMLLRLVQERSFKRLGGKTYLRFKGKIIAATNKNLKHLVDKNKIMEDLYWRLKIHEIEIPPLYIRPDDIEELVLYFMKQSGTKKKISYETVARISNFYSRKGHAKRIQEDYLTGKLDNEEDKALIDAFKPHGEKFLENNAREINNLVKKLIIETGGKMNIYMRDLELLEPAYKKSLSTPDFYRIPGYVKSEKTSEEKDMIRALEITKGNQTQVAKLFRMTPQAINQRIYKNERVKDYYTNSFKKRAT